MVGLYIHLYQNSSDVHILELYSGVRYLSEETVVVEREFVACCSTMFSCISDKVYPSSNSANREWGRKMIAVNLISGRICQIHKKKKTVQETLKYILYTTI